MKKCILLLLTLLLSSASLVAQERTKDFYLQKAKKQKTAAWILLGSGAAIAAIGGIIQLNHENNRSGGFDFDFTGATIAIVGGVVCLSSIPFFIVSSSNKKKGMSLSFSSGKAQQIRNRSFAYSPVPSLTLKVSL
jgi:hypothetical protein